eukprot:scaffold803_cov310-Pinguiococcus_pyrenoidosus.AAC.152
MLAYLSRGQFIHARVLTVKAMHPLLSSGFPRRPTPDDKRGCVPRWSPPYLGVDCDVVVHVCRRPQRTSRDPPDILQNGSRRAKAKVGDFELVNPLRQRSSIDHVLQLVFEPSPEPMRTHGVTVHPPRQTVRPDAGLHLDVLDNARREWVRQARRQGGAQRRHGIAEHVESMLFQLVAGDSSRRTASAARNTLRRAIEAAWSVLSQPDMLFQGSVATRRSHFKTMARASAAAIAATPEMKRFGLVGKTTVMRNARRKVRLTLLGAAFLP